ncbi:Putative BTB/POZ domain-containing protein [Septoria linicola]|uniref:BTB/POZ domain-containing protein n=1 Tax=Septoria linicola TaxID=215465 RepID=A0A9Q9EN23_9PEZI|nr:putative BTB/POZ domain-containing protein [Septoria linicola]USW56640.1 Putative BTB/POZ domain-containing protein [Septoria linicola]
MPARDWFSSNAKDILGWMLRPQHHHRKQSKAVMAEPEGLADGSRLSTGNFVLHEKSCDAFLGVFTTGEWSDLTIIAGGREFKVHRSVVCHGSPFLQAACSRDWQARTGVVRLPEDETTVHLLLSHLYGADLKHPSEYSEVQRLLAARVAADKGLRALETGKRRSPESSSYQRIKRPWMSWSDFYGRLEGKDGDDLADTSIATLVYALIVSHKYRLKDLRALLRRYFVSDLDGWGTDAIVELAVYCYCSDRRELVGPKILHAVLDALALEAVELVALDEYWQVITACPDLLRDVFDRMAFRCSDRGARWRYERGVPDYLQFYQEDDTIWG